MITTFSTLDLRKLLLLDAFTCAAMGILLVVANTLIAGLTAIPASLLVYAGAALFPIAAFMAFTALRALHKHAVWLIVLGNLMWVAASIWLLTGGWIAPNTFGSIFISVQAFAVTVLAALEYSALRSLKMTTNAH